MPGSVGDKQRSDSTVFSIEPHAAADIKPIDRFVKVGLSAPWRPPFDRASGSDDRSSIGVTDQDRGLADSTESPLDVRGISSM
jgi:hypothetical protein